ncbi:12131_t:CDS:2 [Funneliformis geosporum]|nr:12131_t:CDS:2 [Funneliformis geosporum]
MPTQNNLGGAAAASLLEFDSSIPYEIFIRNLKLLRVGQVIVDFEIILEKNRVIFYGSPNDKSRTVRGKVRLEVAGKLNVKEIMITLAGEFHIANENTTSFTSDEIPFQGTLFSTCILLANKRTLNPGVHEFLFEFSLPVDLPESMSSDLILCEYFLKAEIIARGLGDLKARNKVVDVVDLFVQRAMLQSDDYIKQGLDASRYTGSRDKVLDFEFLLPKILRLNTDVLTFHARWDGLRVDYVTFLFVQTESFRGSHADEGHELSSDRKTKAISGPFRFDMPRKEPLKLQSRPMTFQLPITEPFVRDYNLCNVEIRHQLIISIQMANKNKESIQLCIPIMIESISASEYTADYTSNENSNTIATTVTYTNNTEQERNTQGFPQKGSQKPTFVTNSGNVIADKITKINHLLQRNRSNMRSIPISKKGAKRPVRAASSASAAKFGPLLHELMSRFPNANAANVKKASLTT